MKIGITKETGSGERRVAGSPTSVKRLKEKFHFEVVVESGAGVGAEFADNDYEAAGATIVATEAAWGADVVLAVRPPTLDQVEQLREGATFLSFIWPAQNEDLVKKLAERKISTLAMDAVPRISRAQKCDALSSMANIAGYRAVVEAAHHFGRFFTGQMTAAGKSPPAKVLVIGAGVAGLAAIGAAKGLGAIVRAFDVRPSVKDQVKSMGAEFLELDFDESGEGAGGYAKTMSKEFIEAEMALFRAQAEDVDIIITTALIPGKKAPILIDKGMVESMTRGSVIVDLAAEQGGNCEVTEAGKVVEHHGVRVVGFVDLPSRMATQASNLYANNLVHLLDDMGGADDFKIDFDDEVVRGALITHEGDVTWPPPKEEKKEPKKGANGKDPDKSANAAPKPAPIAETKDASSTKKKLPEKKPSIVTPIATILGVLFLLFLGNYAPSDFLAHLTVFVLACFVGWQVIWNVSAALHTPLMSVTNAISGIIIVGGMLHMQAGTYTSVATILGAIAILIATINIAGGFVVTQRMLRMFRKN